MPKTVAGRRCARIGMPGFALLLFAPATFVSGLSAAEWPLDRSTEQKSVEILKQGLHGDEFWPAMHAAEGLTLGGHGDLVREALEPKLLTEKDDQQRCGLARELVRAGDREKRYVMLNILAGDDPHGHVHAAESLYKVGEIGDGTALRDAFENSDNLRLRLMAAGALAKAGNVEALAFLRKTLQHDDPDIDHIAAWLLGRVGDETDIPRLKASLERCDDPFIAAYHEHSLASLGDPGGQKALQRNLTSDDERIRTYAATFAGDASAFDLQAELVAMLDDPHLDARYRAAQSLLDLDRQHHQPAPTPVTAPTVTLKLPPSEDNPRNSEGDFIHLNDGRVLFVFTRFTGGAGDHAPADLVGRFSSDGGRTWDDEAVTILPNESGFNVMSVSLLRLQDGRIALFYLRKNSLEDCRPILRYSDDEGQSWSEPHAVISDDEIGYYVLNNDRVIQLSSGRLLVPVAQHLGPGQSKWTGAALILCYYSDDSGQTWQRGELAPVNESDAEGLVLQEPGVVELPDGRILIFCRANKGSQFMATSNDAGRSWSPLTGSPLASPLSPASIERIPATGDLLAVWNDHSEIPAELKGKRTPFTVALSHDEGKTWQRVAHLADNPHGWYCYTAVDFVGGNVLLGHCAGDRRQNNGLAETHVTVVPVRWLYETASQQ